MGILFVCSNGKAEGHTSGNTLDGSLSSTTTNPLPLSTEVLRVPKVPIKKLFRRGPLYPRYCISLNPPDVSISRYYSRNRSHKDSYKNSRTPFVRELRERRDQETGPFNTTKD